MASKQVFPNKIEAGLPAEFHFSVENSQEAKPFITLVNENLNWFEHIHLSEQTENSFHTELTFPQAGKYYVYLHALDKENRGTVDKKEIWVEEAGDYRQDWKPDSDTEDKLVSQAGQSIPFEGEKFVSEIEGFTINLENGKDLKTHRTQGLEFTIFKDGVKVNENNLEPNPDIFAQLTMIGLHDKEYVILHPKNDQFSTVYAETYLETPGIYRIWLEFQLESDIHTADFTVQVEKNENNERESKI